MTVPLMLPGISCAEDLSNRFGLSGILGTAIPVAPDYVTSNTDSVGLNLGVLWSFFVSPGIGMGISYESMFLGKGQRISPIDLVFLYRMFPERTWTPTFQAGMGSAKGINSTRIENINFKAGFGVDWFIAPSISAGPQVNYYFISHSADATTEAHIIGVNFLVSYYFGSTYASK